MNIVASFFPFPPQRRRATHGVRFAGLCGAMAASITAVAGLRAADPSSTSSSSTDRLISRLPDPAQFSKSPLETAVEDPAEKTPEFQRIVADVRRRDLKAALAEARTLSARFPDSHAQVHLMHGTLALVTRSYAEADQAIHKYIAMTPQRAIGWVLLSANEFAQQHYQAALVDGRKAVAVESGSALGWLAICSCEMKLRQLPAATDAARHATQVDRRSMLAWYTVGRCEIMAHQFDLAAADFQRAANISPGALPVWGALALAYIEAGKPGSAIPPLEYVVSHAPGDIVAATKLGYCYMTTGRAAQGAEVCRRVVHIQPKYAAGWDMYGQCLHRAGMNREAVDAFQHAVSLAPGDLNVRTRLDDARQAAGPAHT